MKRLFLILGLLMIGSGCVARQANAQARLKDIAGVQGARGNQLVGYGLVVGLEGTGDSSSALFTNQSVASALTKLGVTVASTSVKVKNVAGVLVTADLPAFVKNGGKIDVTVSSLGDAKSLQGGTLVYTLLKGVDGEVYAAAQGPITIGGFNVSGGGSTAQKNHVNVGRIPSGASVEREVPTSVTNKESSVVEITLKQPDFTTANRIADAINAKVPTSGAMAMDPYTVRVGVPQESRGNLVRFLSELEALTVMPDAPAKIIINEKTGTIVISGNVRISPCVIGHGDIQVKIENTPVVVQAQPLTKDKSQVVPFKDVTVKEEPIQLAALPATTTVDELVRALNKLGVTPRDLMTILQSMRSAGHINAEIEVQ